MMRLHLVRLSFALLVGTILQTSLAGKLALVGSQSVISFDDDAEISATCKGKTPAFKGIQNVTTQPGNMVVTLELSGIPLSCVNVPQDQPCATASDLSNPALFGCTFSGPKESFTTKKMYPRTSNVEVGDSLVGIAVFLDCEIPQAKLETMTGFTGQEVDTQLKAFATFNDNILPFNGIDGYDQVNVLIDGISPPSSPPPSSPPPSGPPPAPPVDSCSGENALEYNGDCWYLGRDNQNCNTVCSFAGKSFSSYITAKNVGHTMCTSFYNANMFSVVHQPDDSRYDDANRMKATFNGNWVSVGCCFAENGHWGASGGTPDPNFKSDFCNMACGCD